MKFMIPSIMIAMGLEKSSVFAAFSKILRYWRALAHWKTGSWHQGESVRFFGLVSAGLVTRVAAHLPGRDD